MNKTRMKITEIIQKASALAKDGLFHIFGSSVIAQIGGLISSVIVIQRLPKTEYGYYVDANNLYSYLTVFIGLGLTTAILQFCSEQITDKRRGAIYRFSMIRGNLANLVLFAVVWIISFIKLGSGDIQVAHYLQMLSALPFAVYLNTFQQMILRVNRQNRVFSFVNIFYTCLVVVGNIAFTMLWSIPGLIISNYIAQILTAVVCYFLLRRSKILPLSQYRAEPFSRADKKEITQYSLICAITNFTSTILILLDVTCLGLVLSNPDVLADYKVASTIPAACLFIPSCLTVYFYPLIVKKFGEGKESFIPFLKQISKLFIVINGAVFLCLFFGAPLIIRIIFGTKYLNTIPIFRVLSVNYLIYSAVRSLFGNVIAATKHVKVNLLFSVIGGVINIGLDIVLILHFQSIGAAIATVTVTLLMSIMELLWLRNFLGKMPPTSESGTPESK